MTKINDSNRSGLAAVVLAWLPSFFCMHKMEAAAVYSAGVLLFTWITGLLFSLMRPLFPRQGRQFALMVWLTSCAFVISKIWQVMPIWVISVLFLLDADSAFLGQSNRIDVKTLMKRSAGYLALTLSGAVPGEYLNRDFAQSLWSHPAGTFLWMAILLAFWQNQPRESGRTGVQ